MRLLCWRAFEQLFQFLPAPDFQIWMRLWSDLSRQAEVEEEFISVWSIKYQINIRPLS